MRRLVLAVLCLLPNYLLPISGHAAVFFDDTFANSDWTSQRVTLGGVFTSDPTATFSAGQVGSGGNTGAYRETTQTYTGPNLSVLIAHLNTAAVYNPGVSGAFAGANFSFDVNFFNYPGTCCSPSYAVGYAPVVEQGGTIYIGDTAVAVLAQWTSFAVSNQTESSFALPTEWQGPTQTAHPDFSAAGAPITFGYATYNGTGAPFTTSTTSGLDNFSVSTFDIPEPGSLFLLTAAVLGLAARRRR